MTNKHQATRIKDESNSLIDYIIIDGNEPLLYNEFFDSPIQTDHFAQLIILATKLSKNKVIKKQIYDKTNYSPKDFKHSIKQLNWENFYCSTAPSEMLHKFEQNLEQQKNTPSCANQNNFYMKQQITVFPCQTFHFKKHT